MSIRQVRNGLVKLIAVALLATAAIAHADRFFRYTDESGKIVLSHTIPNERVKYGYEVVDQYARVLERVAPQLTEAQYQEKLRKEAARKECRRVVERVLGLFQTLADIDYAEEQALSSIDNQISNTRANLLNLRSQREQLEAQAAQLDLAGKQITNALLDNIDLARTQEQNLVEQIENRNAEKVTLQAEYNFERKVFELGSCDNGLPERELAVR